MFYAYFETLVSIIDDKKLKIKSNKSISIFAMQYILRI